MLMTADSIRELRFRLANALRQANADDDEVLAQLQRALQEHTGDPPDWSIHHAIGSLYLQRGDRSGALLALTKATGSAPEAANDAAALGLEVLRAPDATDLASEIPDDEASTLTAAVRASPDKPVLPSLYAAHLNHLRGDAATSAAILERLFETNNHLPIEVIEELASVLMNLNRASDALRYLDTVGSLSSPRCEILRIRAEIDLGDFDGARRQAEAATESSELYQALALAGAGKLDDAVRILSLAPSSKDVAQAEAILRLRQASLGGSTPEPGLIAAADEAAATASQMSPSDPDALLIRAQVNLECSLAVDEGRRLLSHALILMGRDSRRSWWMRYQHRTRADDSWFHYFLVELAAIQKDDQALLRLAETISRERMTIRQVAAVDMLVAAIRNRRGQQPEAAEAFAAAMRAFDQAGDTRPAFGAAQMAFAAQQTSDYALDLADHAWQLSYETTATAEPGPTASTEEGLAILRRCEEQLSEEQLGRAAVLRGLLLGRFADLVTSQQIRARWQAVPWLIVAALLNPNEPFWASHVAWALHDSGVDRGGLFFAEKAIALSDSSYVQETIVGLHINVFGTIDPAVEDILAHYSGDPKWVNSVLLFCSMLAGQLDEAVNVPADDLLDARWVRDIQLRVGALRSGIGSVEPELRALLEDARRVPADWDLAAEISLWLGEIDSARELIALGESKGEMDPADARYRRACADLVASSGSQGFDVMKAWLLSQWRPSKLAGAANVELPLLLQRYASTPGTVSAISQLIGMVQTRLTQISGQVPLSEGLDGNPDPDSRGLISQMLGLAESAGDARWYEAASRAAELAKEYPDGLMGAALRHLSSSYRISQDTAVAAPAGAQSSLPSTFTS
ncbi:MAG TPA: hypothetical protein VEL12_15535 [Candidatus Nitrosopolaris sp.]|nr:hypothetical protein [Candidatus Nitrosopolaris sp.]